MSQAIDLPDDLVFDAEDASNSAARSPAEQIEFWARLGRAIEPLLSGDASGAGDREVIKPLSEYLGTVEALEGRRRLSEYLRDLPFPHYESVDNRPGTFVRIETDGSRTVGRFVNRQFEAVD